MTTAEVGRDVEDHSVRWAKEMIEKHATPFITIAFGVDHKQGQAVVCMREGVTPKLAIQWLQRVIDLMQNLDKK